MVVVETSTLHGGGPLAELRAECENCVDSEYVALLPLRRHCEPSPARCCPCACLALVCCALLARLLPL